MPRPSVCTVMKMVVYIVSAHTSLVLLPFLRGIFLESHITCP